MRGWTIDDVLAVLWGLCGVGIAAYFVVLAVQTREMGASGIPLLVLAVVVLVGFSIVAVRHGRRARETRAQRWSGPISGWRIGGTAERGARPSRAPAGRPVAGGPPAGRPVASGPPELSASGRAALARIVGVADRAGLLAPRAPRPVDLVDAVAAAGEPVTLHTVLAALPGAGARRPEDHLAALAFHPAHTPQSADTLAGQVDDLARLVGDALPVRLLDVELTERHRAVRTRLRLALGDDERTLDYRGAATELSTVVHVALARALRAAAPEGPRPGRPRLAWTWSERGVWVAALQRTTIEALDAELGRAVVDPWRWVDEQEPTAAGD